MKVETSDNLTWHFYKWKLKNVTWNSHNWNGNIWHETPGNEIKICRNEIETFRSKIAAWIYQKWIPQEWNWKRENVETSRKNSRLLQAQAPANSSSPWRLGQRHLNMIRIENPQKSDKTCLLLNSVLNQNQIPWANTYLSNKLPKKIYPHTHTVEFSKNKETFCNRLRDSLFLKWLLGFVGCPDATAWKAWKVSGVFAFLTSSFALSCFYDFLRPTKFFALLTSSRLFRLPYPTGVRCLLGPSRWTLRFIVHCVGQSVCITSVFLLHFQCFFNLWFPDALRFHAIGVAAPNPEPLGGSHDKCH